VRVLEHVCCGSWSGKDRGNESWRVAHWDPTLDCSVVLERPLDQTEVVQDSARFGAQDSVRFEKQGWDQTGEAVGDLSDPSGWGWCCS
jgi:hypothetical protein